MAEAVYALCALMSILCAVLLLRGYWRSRESLLLWSSLCFTGLAVNNSLLFADLVVFPAIDLSIWRNLVAVASMMALLTGLVREGRS